MPTSRARGHRRPAASRNRAEPVPGSTTWPGPASPACLAAHPIMLATTGAGVSVWPSRLRSAAVLVALSASPSGSPPAAIPARIVSSGSPGPGLEAAAAAASPRSAADRPATRSAPSSSAALTSAGRSPARSAALFLVPGLALVPSLATVTAPFLVAARVPVTMTILPATPGSGRRDTSRNRDQLLLSFLGFRSV